MANEVDVVVAPLVKATAAVGAAVTAQLLGSGPENASVFADLFVLTWGNIASALAALLTFSMLIQHWWKNVWRPLLEKLGLMKPKRRVITLREAAEEDSQSAAL